MLLELIPFTRFEKIEILEQMDVTLANIQTTYVCLATSCGRNATHWSS